MFRTVRLRGFKSVRSEVSVELGALTVLAGANSSGKSTLLQALLMLSQTMSSKANNRPVILNGPQVRLGSIQDTANHGEPGHRFHVGIDLEPNAGVDFRPPRLGRPDNSLVRLLDLISLDLTIRKGKRELTEKGLPTHGQPAIEHVALSCLSQQSRTSNHRYTLSARPTSGAKENTVSAAVGREESRRNNENLRLTPTLDAASRAALKTHEGVSRAVGISLDHFLPEYLLVQVDINDDVRRNGVTMLIKKISGPSQASSFPGREEQVVFPLEFREFLNKALPAFMQTPERRLPEQFTIHAWGELIQSLTPRERTSVRTALRKSSSTLSQALKQASFAPLSPPSELRPAPVPEPLRTSSRVIDNCLSRKVKYLGPLREEPLPIYPLSASADNSDVGTKGQYTAATLNYNRDVEVNYLAPTDVASGNFGAALKTQTLSGAVDEWLQYLGVSERVQTSEMGSRGHDLRVFTSDGDGLDLTQVGVGVSQVLPILVLGLLADTDSIVIFEQPELHLHPRVQTRLADFFVSMLCSNLQCVVETHSEYIVNRLRLRVAETDYDLSDYIRLYFTEIGQGGTRYRPVEVDRFGRLDEWPKGFFDEAQREAEQMLRASIRKRRQETRPNA